MPRTKRLEYPGGIFHVISRGIERRQLYRDRKDREEFLRRLGLALKETQTQCYAWVLMGNHFHLLLRPLDNPLSSMMRKLMTGYAIYFNARHRRVGHLFQNRYKSILCQEDCYFKELLRYIHLNPVRAKLVNTLSELSSYPWSGHTYILGKKKNDWQEVDEVLCHFSSERKFAIRLYKQFIKDGWNMGTRNDLLGGGLVRSAGGQKGLRLLKKLKKRWQYDSRILGDGDFVKDVLQGNDDIENQRFFIQQNYDTERIAKIICDKYEIDKSELFSGRRARYLTKPKGMFSFFTSEYLGLPLSVIGKKLKVSGVSAYNLKTIGKKAVQEEGNFLIS